MQRAGPFGAVENRKETHNEKAQNRFLVVGFFLRAFYQALTLRLVLAQLDEEGGGTRLYTWLVHHWTAGDRLNARPIWP